MLQDLAEADEDGQRDAAQLEVVDQLLKVDATRGILVGVDPQVAVLADREVTLAPGSDIVEFGGVGGGPAVGGFAHGGRARQRGS
jgi:hypothetical protein